MRAVFPRLAVAAVAAALVAGCGSGVPDIELPQAPPTSAAAPTTTLPDYRGVALAPVPGRTTTTIPAIGPGNSQVRGTVVGPDGPVPGATVRLERFVGDLFTRLDVLTGPDGAFVADRVLGGRYRVRAWRAPDLTVPKPVVFYLEDGKTQPVDFTLRRRDGIGVRASIAPSAPIEDEPANLVVAVTSSVVDPEGIVRRTPVAGATVDLTVPPDWAILTPDPVVTDGAGRAGWQVECGVEGSSGVYVVIGDQTYALSVPACSAPPPETTVPPSTSTTVARATTTTRERRGGGGGNRP